MRILIIGASRGTGALAVQAALGLGHDVSAFARQPDRIALQNSRLSRVSGDFHDPASVLAAVRGHDAVIVTASSSTLKGFKEKPDYFSRGTRAVIDAMKASEVKRLVVLSAFGVGESRRAANFFLEKLLISFLLKAPYADHERQEAMVMQSGLDWVIARPTRLTDGPARGTYAKKAEPGKVPNSISRADVADFLVAATTTDAWLHKAVQLGG